MLQESLLYNSIKCQVGSDCVGCAKSFDIDLEGQGNKVVPSFCESLHIPDIYAWMKFENSIRYSSYGLKCKVSATAAADEAAAAAA